MLQLPELTNVWYSTTKVTSGT